MLFKKILPLCLLFFIVQSSIAQKHYTKREMKKNPVWIQMIKDERANYFETAKAFNLYFSTHRFPVMEEEEMGKNQNLKERIEKSEAKFKKKKRRVKQDPGVIQREKDEEAKMAFEVKRFNHWEMQTLPYVKDDGSIMDAEERMKIWKESKNNSK